MRIVDVARICHEVNRAFCEGLGDASQKPWAEAPVWQQDTGVMGVVFHLSGIHNNTPHGPEASHEGWWKEKIRDGWKYGPVKDAEKKEHPCCVPYSELPREQQAKDSLFLTVVEGLAHLVIS